MDPESSVSAQTVERLKELHNAYVTLGRKHGAYIQGLEAVSAFKDVDRNSVEQDAWRLGDAESGIPAVAHDRALFLLELGELAEAEAILRSPLLRQVDGYYPGGRGKARYQFVAKLNLCDVLTLQGRLTEAYALADALVAAYQSEDVDADGASQKSLLEHVERINGHVSEFASGFNPYAQRAIVRTWRGDIGGALADFKQAEALQQARLKTGRPLLVLSRVVIHEKLGRPVDMRAILKGSSPEFPLLGQAVIFYAVLLTRLGKLCTAQRILEYSRRWAMHWENHFPAMTALAEVALSEVHRLLGDYIPARQYLDTALSWAADTQQKEVACWGRLSLARWHLAQGETTSAHAAAMEALALAEKHGYGLYRVDGQLIGGRIAMIQGDLDAARTYAEQAFYAATDPDYRYAWGHGSALHLLAEVWTHPGYPSSEQDWRLAQAEALARDAIKVRMRIQDPRLANSEDLLTAILAQKGDA